MQMLDSNSFYLNEYLHQQDINEGIWQMTKNEKRSYCATLAANILLQQVDIHTFELAFGENYINHSEDKYEWLISTLEDIELGICDPVLMRAFVTEALDAAAFCLYDCELEELLDDRLAQAPQIEKLIDEVGAML